MLRNRGRLPAARSPSTRSPREPCRFRRPARADPPPRGRCRLDRRHRRRCSATKSGLGGAAVKAGYAAVKRLGGNFVTRATDRLLPQFAGALDPFWETKGEQPFGTHLAARSDAAADALLAVTDTRAAKTSHSSAAKVYGSLRSKAKGHVVAALPRLGAAVERLVV